MYELLLLVGALGSLAMVLMGMAHTGGHHGGHALGGHHGGHAVGGHHGGHALGGHDAHGAHGGQSAHGGHAAHGAHGHGAAGQTEEVVALTPAQNVHLPVASQGRWISFIPSPLDIFSIALGAGATGMIVRGMLGAVLTPWIALLGGLVLNFAITRPLIGLFMGFGSKESEGLEGQLAHAAIADSRFDAQGRGIVRLTLDGQLSTLLAQLEPDELAAGVEVHKGDEVLVVEVDPKAGKCKVSREMGRDRPT